jgi:5-(carboxyamino)imidazole ribonucleotide mutase
MSVLVILGSKSDARVGEKVTKALDKLKITYRIVIASAHRTPKYLMELVEKSEADIFIGVAGLAAALPGAIASHTHRPVIGVPVSGKVNLDSILSITQMPPGVPVAAVGLDNGENAAILAAEMLAIKDKELERRLKEYREERSKAVLEG